MTNMFTMISTITMAMLAIISILGIFIFAGWLATGTFVAKNGKKLLARFNRNGLPHDPRDPWSPRSQGSGRQQNKD